MTSVVVGTAYSTRPPSILTQAVFSCSDPHLQLINNGNGTYSATTSVYKIYYIRCDCPGFRSRIKPWDAQNGDIDTINFPMIK